MQCDVKSTTFPSVVLNIATLFQSGAKNVRAHNKGEITSLKNKGTADNKSHYLSESNMMIDI